MKPRLQLIIILTTALFLRIFWLNIIPAGITNDELHFVLNAKSVFLNFSNLANNWNPLSLKTIPHESSSELSFLLLSPLIGPLPLNLFTSRLTGAILGTLTVFILYLLAKHLFGAKIAIFVSVLAAINPWFIYFSRTAFDAPLAVFFILLSIYLLLSNKNIFFIILSILFSFYTYIGTKILVFPFMFITSYFVYITNKRQSIKKLLLVNIFTLALSLNYGLNLYKSDLGNRIGELISFSDPKISLEVNQNRQYSQTPGIFKTVFNNKLLSTVKFSFGKFLNSFSPNLLFLKGDETFTGSLWKHGYFYPIEIFTIIFGFLYLFSKYRPAFWLLAYFLLLSPLPEAIRKDSIPAYALHSAFQYPFFVFLSGIGLYYLFSLKNKLLNIFLTLSFTTGLLIFINLYFFEYPYYAADSFSLKNRIISYYLQNEIPNHPVLVLCKEPDALFKNYIFFSNSLNRKSFKDISISYSNRLANRYILGNLTFTSNQNDLERLSSDSTVIIEEGINSGFDSTSKQLMLNLDHSQTLFSIYNGSTCLRTATSTKIISLNKLTSNPDNFCPLFFSSVSL